MQGITVKELKALMEKWNKENLKERRDGEIINIETGELTGLEWAKASEATRQWRRGFRLQF